MTWQLWFSGPHVFGYVLFSSPHVFGYGWVLKHPIPLIRKKEGVERETE